MNQRRNKLHNREGSSQSLDMLNIPTFDCVLGHCVKCSCQMCQDPFALRTLRTAFAIDRQCMLVSCLASAISSSCRYGKQPCLENVHAGNGSPLCCHTCSLSRSIPCTPRTSFPWRHMRKRSCCRSFRLIVVGRSESMFASVSWALCSTSSISLCLWRTCEPWCMS